MVVIPKKKAILENLNSYYVDILKLIEHFQGEIGSGSIYFKSRSTEGVIFFDQNTILDGFYIDDNGDMAGMATVDQLIKEASSNNCTLSIHRIDPENIYFWSQIHEAERIYNNLSSEFTELSRLIKKMSTEKLTGYIDITVGDREEGGLLFFRNGNNLGGAYSWGNGELDSTDESLTQLIEKSKELGGIFHVNKIEFPREKKVVHEPPSIRDKEKEDEKKEVAAKSAPNRSEILHMLELFLNIMEKIVRDKKSIKDNFSTLLKRKFVEKANQYEFLDPFEAEFEYQNQKITFFGDAPQNELARGVMESVKELSRELGVEKQLKKESKAWSDKYSATFQQLGISY